MPDDWWPSTTATTTAGTSIAAEWMITASATTSTVYYNTARDAWFTPDHQRPADAEINAAQEVALQRVREAAAAEAELVQRAADERQTQRQRMHAARLEEEERRQKRRAEKVAAQTRGLELLDSILTPEQVKSRRQMGYVMVTGSDGGNWQVTMSDTVHGNTRLYCPDGCRVGTLCVAPEMKDDGRVMPRADGWVGQILAIQCDEAGFRKAGNWSYVKVCRHDYGIRGPMQPQREEAAAVHAARVDGVLAA